MFFSPVIVAGNVSSVLPASWSSQRPCPSLDKPGSHVAPGGPARRGGPGGSGTSRSRLMTCSRCQEEWPSGSPAPDTVLGPCPTSGASGGWHSATSPLQGPPEEPAPPGSPPGIEARGWSDCLGLQGCPPVFQGDGEVLWVPISESLCGHTGGGAARSPVGVTRKRGRGEGHTAPCPRYSDISCHSVTQWRCWRLGRAVVSHPEPWPLGQGTPEAASPTPLPVRSWSIHTPAGGQPQAWQAPCVSSSLRRKK